MIKKIALIFVLVILGWGIIRSLPRTVKLGGKTLKIEYARTGAEREKGLSGRKSLCPDCGLLFVFDQPGFYPFWMKEMYFDIDIIWLKDSQVVDITQGAKKPVQEEFESPKTIYTSKTEVNQVLEVNSGWAGKNNIQIGSTLTFF